MNSATPPATSSFHVWILAGGRGQRFWPASRERWPKQFLDLEGNGQSLLQATAARLLPAAGSWSNVHVLTTAQLAAACREQLPQANVVAEPEGRDTAAAIAWAALCSARADAGAMVGVFPADHRIVDAAGFRATVGDAMAAARTEDAIVTIGIAPTHPATTYGYIELATRDPAAVAHPVRRFVEKPDRERAAAFLASGDFVWNAGMFVARAAVLLDAFRAAAPEVIGPLAERGLSAYPQVPKRSFDYAVMESYPHVRCVAARFDWDDLGDWRALERLHAGAGGNTWLAPHVAVDTERTLAFAPEGEVVATLGVRDLFIVRSGSITLVATREHLDRMKELLAAAESSGKPDIL